MNYQPLAELISKYCPDGVEFVELRRVLNYSQPTKYLVSSTDYSDEFRTPVLTAGQTFILGFTEEETGIYPASPENPVIIFDDFTTAFKWVDFPFKAKSSAMKMITPTNQEIALFRYLFYAMSNISFSPVEHSRHWISTYSTFKIPLPPTSVQREIVRILDLLTELQLELQAELQARRSQYEYFRDSYFDFTADDTNVEWLKLGKLLTRRKGTAITAGRMKELSHETGQVRVFAAGQTFADVEVEEIPAKDLIQGPVIIIKSRGYIGFEWYEGLCTHKSELWSYVNPGSNINLKFIFYYLQTKQRELQELARSKSVKLPQLSVSDTDQMLIPIPNREIQDRIVLNLDALNDLSFDRTIGLPAEIEARLKQYEYYRDQLLTFKELAA